MLNVCGFRILVDCPLDLSALTIFAPVLTEPYSELDEGSLNYGDDNSESVARKKQKVEKPLDAKSLIHAEPWYKTVKNLHLWNASFIDVVLISSPMGMLGLPFLTRMTGFSAKIYVTEVAARLGQLMMEDLLSMHMEFRQLYGPNESDFPSWMESEELESLPVPLREISFGKNGEELGAWMPLYRSDLILYSDFSFMESIQESEVENNSSGEIHSEEISKLLLRNDDITEEMDKLTFICSCAIDTVKDGGSVLIPMNRIGNFLKTLEHISVLLESSTLKVPIYIISSIAEELLSYTNIIPEWLCKERQEKEPCIVFSPHWSLRLGPTVHLLHRWCQDERSLLVLDNEVNPEIALLPFKPMAMKVLQCSFLSGIK
ncbi:hypothetical protein ACFE04_021520 [Oxalis oulophora]